MSEPIGYVGPSEAFRYGPLPWPPTQEEADRNGVELIMETDDE